MKPNEKQFIFADEVDYANTPDKSVWGEEDKITADLLNKTGISGTWLNLCAGDGRFNRQLLQKADRVIAVDIDKRALQKLIRITPKTLVKKLVVKKLNITKKLPFKNNTFDGVFSVGTMHLFPRPIFTKILDEIDRVLKPGGRIILDFAADIKRTFPDGSLWIVENEPNYTLKQALAFVKKSFITHKTEVLTAAVDPEEVILDEKKYIFTSNLILVNAVKNNRKK